MANNCEFSVTMICKHEDLPKASRVLDIINLTDPEYVFARSWPDMAGVVAEDRYDHEHSYIQIQGQIAWTAAYLWCPRDTLCGKDVGDIINVPDVGPRIVTSIPELCKLWGMQAQGWEYEPGCEVDGTYESDANGNLTYEDCWSDDDGE